MRDLPDHASLDHLRRQAKDQLAVLRRTASDATLTDAQASVARQYGFASWASLKNEVERRTAAAPLVADERLVGRLAIAFGLGTVSRPMTQVERQWTGQVWDLTTTDGRWVVTALANFVVPATIQRLAAALT